MSAEEDERGGGGGEKEEKNLSQWLQWNLLAVKDGEGEEGESEAEEVFLSVINGAPPCTV